MTIDDIITAKVNLIQTDAITAIGVGSIFLVLALIFPLVGWALGRNKPEVLDSAVAAYITAVICAIIALPTLCQGLYNYKTATLRARADAANYRLVESLNPR